MKGKKTHYQEGGAVPQRKAMAMGRTPVQGQGAQSMGAKKMRGGGAVEDPGFEKYGHGVRRAPRAG